MKYKVMFKEDGRGRSENYFQKSYASKKTALIAQNREIKKYKGNKYIKDVVSKNFKIIKVRKKTRGFFPKGFM